MTNRTIKTFCKLILAACVAFGLLQLIRPGIPERTVTAELQAPAEVRHILEKDCYSCHSDQRRLSWFDQIVPAYWLVRHDVLTARHHLNFSTLASKPAAAQKATLYEAVNMVQLGAMPLPQFVALHPEAKVTPDELATLKAYLAPWTPALVPPPGLSSNKTETFVSSAANLSQAVQSVSLNAVQPESSGFAFDPSFESWKLISTTDRGDNNTFRFILGNDIAVKAAQEGNISPWPDGTRFAKIAWQQEIGPDGLVHPGKFIQVELMLKSAQPYKSTEGWGWGRWRGMDLKPYGANAQFVNECTGCHQPMHGNDFVYTLPIATAKLRRDDILNNPAAVLPAGLPFQPLGWNAITMYVDPRNRITATLYGNDVAIQAARQREHPTRQIANAPKYPAGSVLALVTWAQRDDPHWFGARIPNVPLSVEFVQNPENQQRSVYRDFTGTGLIEKQVAPNESVERIGLIQGLIPVQLP